MDRTGEPSDTVSGELFAKAAEATSDLEPPLSPQSVLQAIKSAIKEYSSGTGLPELAERIGQGKIPEIIGGLMLLEPLKSETLRVWRQDVDKEIMKTDKLPRKTKKALQKKKSGKPLGQRELARLQALREQERRGGD